MRRIRLNLSASLLFNAAGVPLAAGALFPVLRWRLPPEAAAAAMAASSVCVVLSSLSLKGHRSPHLAPAEAPPAAAEGGSGNVPRRGLLAAFLEERAGDAEGAGGGLGGSGADGWQGIPSGATVRRQRGC